MMEIETDPNKFLYRWQWLEVGFGKNNTLIRTPNLCKIDELEAFRWQHENIGIYHSIWLRETDHIDDSTIWGPLYFDFDSKDNVENALIDTQKLVDYLLTYIPKEAIYIYFSGNKGFHVQISPFCLGITPSNDLAQHFKYILSTLRKKLDLATLDLSVIDARRMWRLTYSKHPVSRLYKIPIQISELYELPLSEIIKHAAEPPKEFDTIKTKVSFNLDSNRWFRSFEYEQHSTKLNKIAQFEKYGTYQNVDFEQSELEFDPITAFNGPCDVLRDLWKKAEQSGDLTHIERLIACSLLTYNNEALEYLYAILRNCTDYDYHKSKAHIEDWIKRREQNIGGRPMTCETIKNYGIICSGCDKLEPHIKKMKIGNKLVPIGDELVEPSPIRLLYTRKRS